MANKPQIFHNLLSDTMLHITSDRDAWLGYLRSISRHYKYSFSDVLLIYAQRPDASACATMETWNKLGRWVNAGAKGIALLDASDAARLRLRYVFDVGDTNSQKGYPPRTWELTPDTYPAVTETLANAYQVETKDRAMPDIVTDAAEVLTIDNGNDYIRILENSLTGSSLARYSEADRDIYYLRAIYASVAAAMLFRGGWDSKAIKLVDEHKQYFPMFNTPETASQLCGAVCDIAEMGLREIESTVRAEQKKKIRTFANFQQMRDNGPKEETQPEERSQNYGTDLHEEGRLPVARPDAGRDTAAGQVRTTAATIPQNGEPSNVRVAAGDRPVDSASGSGAEAGDGASAADGKEPSRETERDRGTESPRPDDVGGHDEQHQAQRRGERTGGPDLYLNDNPDTPQLPTPEQQAEAIEQAETEKVPALSYSQEQIDNAILLGGNVENSKLRIYEQFQKHLPIDKIAAFLKNEYGTGSSSTLSDDPDISFNGKGLYIGSSFWGKGPDALYLSWKKVAKRISALIDAGRYLTDKEKAKYEKYRAEKTQDKSERTYSYHLGDTVYIGKDEYTISGIGDPMRLHDETFPLIDTEMPRAEFERKVRENPRNDHLLGAGETEQAAPDEADDFSDIDPAAIRAELAKRGIVDGQVVDKAANDASPFISQVMQDVQRLAEEENPVPDISEHPITREGDSVTIGDGPATHEITVTLPDDAWEQVKEAVSETPVTVTDQPAPLTVPVQNYRITDDNLGSGGAKAKYAANIAAIQTLRTVESEHRNATPEEQEILSRYVGWGGVPDAFDPDKPAWAKEYQELKDLLTPDEYNSARSSTLNAHYTSPTVIRAMYQALENMGFRSGNILEPSCGVGNFFGMLPESMTGSKLYGVELDSLTGRIAKLLYPKADITVAGFETTNRRDFYDVAIGNVPFGRYQVNDPTYNKLHFSIHNYFFAKSLDQVRPGGVVAFVVSRYLMDAKDPIVRKYLAQRAELLGAFRLPNNAFKDNANTEVVTDVLFLQKREQPIVDEPDWVHLGQTEQGIPINSYYIDHPEMVLGEISTESTQYGRDELTVNAVPGAELSVQLETAIQNITGRYEELAAPELAEEDEDKSIPADPDVRNFSYTLVDGEVYYRENSRMKPVQASTTALNRVRGLVGLRDCVQQLIDCQMEDAPDEIVEREQARLNGLYDAFTAKYGLINSRGNEQAFSDDSSYFLLCSLEILDKDGKLERKADFFTKRTIRRPEHVTHVDTASEALTISLNEKGKVDMEYMEQLTGKPAEQMESDLQGVIFRDTGRLTQQQADSGAFDVDELPLVPADEYLSGNVRQKLTVARAAQKAQPIRLAENVTALEKVQPVDLTASEISVRLGATWIPVEVVERFMYHLLEPPFYYRHRIRLHYTKATGEWYIENKSTDRGNVAVTSTYGTKRASAYRLLEDALNLRDTKIFDYVEDADGKRKAVLNKNETTIAQQKQDMIRQAFADWIWEDQTRRDRLCKLYNEKFNSLRPREYDGSHLTFPGMNPQIKLRPHQTSAIAHILYGGNTLLAHCVGAGKTYEMAAAAMESKRLGLAQKAMFVVPNHIISQWASEFLQLYPFANLLVARKKDFEAKNRKKFCGRIATGDYDAIIIGHSQFEKIAMSLPRQRYLLESQINEIIRGIEEIKYNKGERSTIKSLERTRKSLQAKLDKLNDQSRKDDVIDFEALGVDRLFIDEAHYYKNLFLFSKMRNVSGISQTEAQKSSDLFLKCRYLDEQTGNHGVVFATGTPVSNSMVELYTMQRYLQYDRLAEQELVHFDSWASTFGETVTAIELAPEGYNF